MQESDGKSKAEPRRRLGHSVRYAHRVRQSAHHMSLCVCVCVCVCVFGRVHTVIGRICIKTHTCAGYNKKYQGGRRARRFVFVHAWSLAGRTVRHAGLRLRSAQPLRVERFSQTNPEHSTQGRSERSCLPLTAGEVYEGEVSELPGAASGCV